MKRRSLLRILFLVNFAVTLGFGIADAFFPAFLFDLGARGLMLGLPLVFYSLAKIFFSPILGAWSDQVGSRKVMLASLFLYLTVSLSYLCSANLQVLTMLRLLQGVSCAMFRPVLLSMVGSCTGDKGRATSLATFDISFYGALCLGPVIGGMLKDALGFPGIFAAVTLLCLSALLAALRGIPADGACGRSRGGDTRTALLEALRRTGRQGGYLGLLAFIFGRACGISLTGTFLPILFTSKLGLSGMRSGLLLASGTAAMTLLLRPVGIICDHAPRHLLVIVGGSAVSVMYFFIPAASGFKEMLPLILAIGVFSALSQPASSAMLVEEGSRHGMGTTVGTFNAVLNLGFVAGPLIGALLHGTLGLAAVFHAAGIIGLAAVALFAATSPSFLTPLDRTRENGYSGKISHERG